MIIDFNTHFGHGPGMVSECGASQLADVARAAGVDCVISSDLASAFREYEQAAQPLPQSLVQFASIGPSADMDLLMPSLAARGIRIYPAYQTWDFGGRKMAEMLSIARDSELVVQIYLRLQDPRMLPQTTAPAAIIAALNWAVKEWADVRFVISGASYFEVAANLELFRRENIWFDISHIQHPINSLPKLVGMVGESRIIFGSNAPIFYPYANVFRVMHSALGDREKEQIFEKNAQAILDITS